MSSLEDLPKVDEIWEEKIVGVDFGADEDYSAILIISVQPIRRLVHYGTIHGSVPSSYDLDEFMRWFKKSEDQTQPKELVMMRQKIPTGDATLDRITEGGPESPFVGVIHGKAKSGRTTKVIQLLKKASDLEVPTLVLTSECIESHSTFKKAGMPESLLHKPVMFYDLRPENTVCDLLQKGLSGFMGRFNLMPKLVLIDLDRTSFSYGDRFFSFAKEEDLVIWMSIQTQLHARAENTTAASKAGAEADLIAVVEGPELPLKVVMYRNGMH